ncbi:HAD family hydrolase [Rummeliibacillus suwonensis]|uniref:HAD family hydrolase n=1 Tax=Rummeliibacillus suwonensis TaxID=1306154 RepID=UPI001FD5C2CE|nr:HAD family hydrolase [Rummeliibacillus suwonensis]
MVFEFLIISKLFEYSANSELINRGREIIYKSIVFDIDGTLIDTEKAVIGSLQKMLKVDYGQEYKIEELSFVLGIPGARALPYFGIEDVETADILWGKYMQEFLDTVSVFDGILDTLKSLRALNIPMGLVTSKTKREIDNDFSKFGLNDFFLHIICADDTVKHKPNPEPLLKYLKVSQTEAKEAIYIGDTNYDLECARDARIDFALALWGCQKPEEVNAFLNLSHPKEIIKLIEI